MQKNSGGFNIVFGALPFCVFFFLNHISVLYIFKTIGVIIYVTVDFTSCFIP